MKHRWFRNGLFRSLGFRSAEALRDAAAGAGDALAKIPDRVGDWRPILRLGEVGMGVVYLAEEIGPLERRAALKRIKHGLDSHRVLERFEQERRVLARMDHPGIARALDAGAAEDGTPYFVSEAIEHAHRRGILISPRYTKHGHRQFRFCGFPEHSGHGRTHRPYGQLTLRSMPAESRPKLPGKGASGRTR